jgi:hypothetical protein
VWRHLDLISLQAISALLDKRSAKLNCESRSFYDIASRRDRGHALLRQVQPVSPRLHRSTFDSYCDNSQAAKRDH